MSNAGGAGCVTCRSRNKKCDLTRGPNGCRRCTQAGIECGGYPPPSSRIPQPKHGTRAMRPGPSTPNEDILPSGLSVPNTITRSDGNYFPIPAIEEQHHNLNFLSRRSGVLTHHQPTNPYSCAVVRHGQIPADTGSALADVVQLLTPPAEGSVASSSTRQPRPGGQMTPGQASLFDSIFSLAEDPPVLPYTPESPALSYARGPDTGDVTRQVQSSSAYSQFEITDDSPNVDEDAESDDPENVLIGVLDGLALDREVESNIVAFVAHAFTSWINRFMFEPGRSTSLARATIVRGLSFGEEMQQRMILVANTVLAVSKSTDCELKYFTMLYQQLVKRVIEARTCNDLTREMAMKAMEGCHELISITSKVGSFANVLHLMDIYAPVFRRACPELSGLVNLPRRLAAPEVALKYFVSYDVLQSMLTHRPMLFRYDLDILSPQDEELLDADDRPGLRWSIGVPNRLVIALARINTLLESYGNCVDPKMVQELLQDIGRACKPIVYSSPEEDPTLKLGRLMVQESWRLVGYVYLYMGLCGADSKDARVVKVQKQFMRLLESIRPRRNPDAFLILPMVILGIATSSPADQSTLLARLWGVSECSKPESVGNDVTRMLNDIWERTAERPAVWSDLRIACLRVTGM
ncbi:unnamed protein product [Rhizoctonia solani]|uniref:Zn(2)-C6 fungal-type domain-containing protein n=1 Tax=Rhizoctonia solani TaxID=456999 RepID=A0A8H3E1G7_9AGAM|nr:unnamed protein product [Rhizoctonia solani]